MSFEEKTTMDNGYEEFKKTVNKPRKSQGSYQVTYSCEQLCGRVSPCGNRHCSNYRGFKKR